MDVIDGLGTKLKDLRNERQLSLDMVVYDIDAKFNIEITKGHLSRWENGKCSPSLRYAAYLAKYYNVSVDYLIGLTDTRVPTDVLARKGVSK